MLCPPHSFKLGVLKLKQRDSSNTTLPEDVYACMQAHTDPCQKNAFPAQLSSHVDVENTRVPSTTKTQHSSTLPAIAGLPQLSCLLSSAFCLPASTFLPPYLLSPASLPPYLPTSHPCLLPPCLLLLTPLCSALCGAALPFLDFALFK